MPPPRIMELLIGAVAAAKLGARGIAARECRELLANGPLLAANPHAGQTGRCLMIGRSSGGRRLTLVIEPTLEPTTWIVVTGWDSSPRSVDSSRSSHDRVAVDIRRSSARGFRR